jgi:ubiquinone/menaquinone biosynthesis C-methylase UbiE
MPPLPLIATSLAHLGGSDASATLARRLRTTRWLRAKDWDEHVDNLEQMADSPAFRALRDRILALASLKASDRLLDVGAGTGLLALAAAPHVARVSALDTSPAMCRHLVRKFERLGIANAEVLVNSATELPHANATVDVVVSNYCLHHLDDLAKHRALAEIRRVLRPGGRLVFGDMMFRLGVVDRRDRAVIALLVKRMVRLGPAGLLRLVKNATRIATGRWEHPASVQWWRDALLQAGFVEVTVQPLDHEGGIAFARRPRQSPAVALAGAANRSGTA